jgi:hypothetical protein
MVDLGRSRAARPCPPTERLSSTSPLILHKEAASAAAEKPNHFDIDGEAFELI